MERIEWKQPDHIRWLGACLFGLIFATLVGGFSSIMAVVVVVVFLTGAVLIGLEAVPSVGLEAAPSGGAATDAPLEQDLALGLAEATPDPVGLTDA